MDWAASVRKNTAAKQAKSWASAPSQASCEAMQAQVKPGDIVLYQNSMTVRYLLPRP